MDGKVFGFDAALNDIRNRASEIIIQPSRAFIFNTSNMCGLFN